MILPFDGDCSTPLEAPGQIQLTWSAMFEVDAHVSLSCPRRVQWGEGLGSLLAMAVDRCAAGGDRDDLCTVSTRIVVLTNKMSMHTPRKRDDEGCQYVVLVVQPSNSS